MEKIIRMATAVAGEPLCLYTIDKYISVVVFRVVVVGLPLFETCVVFVFTAAAHDRRRQGRRRRRVVEEQHAATTVSWLRRLFV